MACLSGPTTVAGVSFAWAACAVGAFAFEPVIRNALIQKPAANFKYFFIDILSPSRFFRYARRL